MFNKITKSIFLMLLLLCAKSTFCQNTAIDADNLYKLGNYEKAIVAYRENITTLNPKQLYWYSESIQKHTNYLDSNYFEILTKAAKGEVDSAQFTLGYYYAQSDDNNLQLEGANWLEKAANNGLVSAQSQLGAYFDRKKDSVKAEYYYLKAASSNTSEGLYELGSYYYSKKQTDKAIIQLLKAVDKKSIYAAEKLAMYYSNEIVDTIKAVYFYDQYILNDDKHNSSNSGYYDLGNLYLEGKTVKLDTVKAFYYFNNAIINNQFKHLASTTLSESYTDGKGFKKDFSKALHYAEIACDDWDIEIMPCKTPIYLATNLFNNSEYKAAINIFKKYSTKLDSNEVNLLGMSYWNLKEYQEAFTCFKRAADMGNPVAMFNVGNCFYEGLGAATNFVEAINWFSLAAAKQYPAAFNYLGNCYFEGKGVTKDQIKALENYQKGTDLEDVGAINNLAYYYINAHGGVKKDLVKATNLLQKACDGGITDACKKILDLKKQIEADKNAAEF